VIKPCDETGAGCGMQEKQENGKPTRESPAGRHKHGINAVFYTSFIYIYIFHTVFPKCDWKLYTLV
jgi:hypothetical protein